MTVATLAYRTSSHAARVLDPIARVAAAGRVTDARRRAEARAEAEHAGRIARAARVEAELVAEYGASTEFGVKVCEEDAKWRAQHMSAASVAWLVVTVGDVEYWEMNPHWDMREV
jgi:hypothetical protein